MKTCTCGCALPDPTPSLQFQGCAGHTIQSLFLFCISSHRYKLLEIELDGIFKCMLLLKKKKYACVKLEPGPNNTIVEVRKVAVCTK
jgi:hypothetical protein